MIDIKTLYPKLIDALIQVESEGDDYAQGDTNLKNKAYGCLQIRQPYVDDINRAFSTHYNASECLGNRGLSIWLMNRYMSMYGSQKRLGHYPPSMQDIARIHNGGPMGYKNSKTLLYWEKVQKYL